MKKSLEKNINSLNLNEKINKVLERNNIFLINDLWLLSRNKLKDFGLVNEEINQIVIKLQLNGLDLNKKVYS